MRTTISALLTESGSLKHRLAQDPQFLDGVERSARTIISVQRGGGTIHVCGNGGSACDAMHLSEELVARYKRERPGIRSMHFLDAGTITCWSNDYAFEGVFARQVETFCTPRDCLVAISTSGKSPNILHALEACRKLGVPSIGFTGKDGGRLKDLCDTVVLVPHSDTERIQEVHITVIHTLCELLETVPTL